jgi:hypothetical protein
LWERSVSWLESLSEAEVVFRYHSFIDRKLSKWQQDFLDEMERYTVQKRLLSKLFKAETACVYRNTEMKKGIKKDEEKERYRNKESKMEETNKRQINVVREEERENENLK